jgi:hypothetical protein
MGVPAAAAMSPGRFIACEDEELELDEELVLLLEELALLDALELDVELEPDEEPFEERELVALDPAPLELPEPVELPEPPFELAAVLVELAFVLEFDPGDVELPCALVVLAPPSASPVVQRAFGEPQAATRAANETNPQSERFRTRRFMVREVTGPGPLWLRKRVRSRMPTAQPSDRTSMDEFFSLRRSPLAPKRQPQSRRCVAQRMPSKRRRLKSGSS